VLSSDDHYNESSDSIHSGKSLDFEFIEKEYVPWS
jgi:hypothetical protein